MLKNVLKKLKESAFSVLPVMAIVFVMQFSHIITLTTQELLVFSLSTALLIIGMTLFNMGSDISMTPMGDRIGAGLVKSKKLSVLLISGFLMGVLITVAEPDLSVLASQVKDKIDSTTLLLTVGVGVGIFLVLAILKIITRKPISAILMFFYMCLFACTAMLVESGNGDFLAIGFDSGGVTTGPITVPFIMALGVGIASTIGGKNASENSFGLIALCSVGPILAVIILGILSSGSVSYSIPDYSVTQNLGADLLSKLLSTSKEVMIALLLIVVFFVILQLLYLKLSKSTLISIGIGVAFTFVGLVIFLTAASIGYMPIGYKIGTELANESTTLLAVIGFVIGAVVVLAEPAVHVLNSQVEEVTNGTVSKRSMMIALSAGVGVSICLSLLRISLGFSLLYYLIPGYIISIGLSFFVPGLYTAIAFDSGGVASGPLTSSFILPLAIGACAVIQGESLVLELAFGIVSMVAMTPLITIQFLGCKAVVTTQIKKRRAMRRILEADDEQIIKF